MTPFRKQFIHVFTGVLMILLAACSSLPAPIPTSEIIAIPSSTPGIPVTAGDLADTQWTLISFTQAGSEIPVVSSSSLTLDFQPTGEVDGSGGCNSFGAQYTQQGTTLLMQQVISTKRACTAQELNEQELRYFEALQSAVRYEQRVDSLRIWYGNGQDFLTFSRGTSSPPVQPAATSTASVPTVVNPTATSSSAGSPQRITFPPGATTVTLTGHLEASESDPYVLRALAGQTMTLDLAFSSGQAILIVWGTDGNVLLSDHAEASHFQQVLPTTQDYNIHVRNRPEGPSDYTLTISIPPLPTGAKRLEFAPGATTASVTGELAASASDEYILGAAAGQTLSVNLTFSEGEAILVIWGADGDVLISDHAAVSTFQQVLRTTQDYHITVHGRPDGNTRYTMTVTIPPAP